MASRFAIVFLFGFLFAVPSLAYECVDFSYLVLRWPGAYCAQSGGCCLPTSGQPAEDFFVTGLSTYDSVTMNPITRCKENATFDIKELSGLSNELNAYWNNIECPNTDGKSIWERTWKTFGVCTGMNETDYFRTALKLRAKVDLLSHLKKKGISPDYSLYNFTDIQSAIAERIGVTPEIRCIKGSLGKFQLYEIYICLNKDYALMECPGSQGFKCSSSILFYPFHDWMLKRDCDINSNNIMMPHLHGVI